MAMKYPIDHRSNEYAMQTELVKVPKYPMGDGSYASAQAEIDYDDGPFLGVTIGGKFHQFVSPLYADWNQPAGADDVSLITALQRTLSGPFYQPVVDLAWTGDTSRRITILSTEPVASIRKADGTDVSLTAKTGLTVMKSGAVTLDGQSGGTQIKITLGSDSVTTTAAINAAGLVDLATVAPLAEAMAAEIIGLTGPPSAATLGITSVNWKYDENGKTIAFILGWGNDVSPTIEAV